jgi:hypothetical protein
MTWELVLLTAITLPFLFRGLVISTPGHYSAGDADSHPYIDLDSYYLWRESHEIYRCDPQRLNAAQLARVKSSCRCSQAMNKHAMFGPDSLTKDECEAVVKVLPTRHPNLDEFPGFEGILNDCRQRLASPNEAATGAQ